MRWLSSYKSWNLNTDTLGKAALLVTLVTCYVLLVYTLIVSAVVLPFGVSANAFVAPAWAQPVAGLNPAFDIIFSIIFGPGIGVTLIATLVVLITIRSVTGWLNMGINDLIYGQHDDAFALISQVNPHISAMNLPHTILPTIATTIAQTLKLPYVELEAESNEGTQTHRFGELPPGAEVVPIPLLYQETQIGELRVSARRRGEALSQSDLTVLRDLARQVGIALYAAQLTGDLQRARVRLVNAREEERRRIRRDLHDGLGPTLANFAMQLEQAREHLPAGATDSELILARLTTQAQNTISDVRRLVYDLRPPDLDEFGLISALREYLHRRQTKQTTLLLQEPAVLPALPAAVEVATYRIVQEAVNNALKHAQAGAITIGLAIVSPALSGGGSEPLVIEGGLQRNHPRALRVEIADNGIGIPADHPVGIGLHSMRERAEELGGSCTIHGSDEGTTVVAYLPIQDQEK